MDATADMSLQESCRDAARHLSAEVHLLAAKADRLEVENAKLRKLCWRLFEAERVGGTLGDWSEIHDRMRELGIEVS